MKTALLLEGGAMRGMYTNGVLDVLMEQRIAVDGIVSVSAGALFGINYKTNQPGRALAYQKKYLGRRDYIGLFSLLTTGNIMNREFCFDRLINELAPLDYDTFAKSPVEFYVTVTNLESGRAEYFRLTDLKDHDQLELLRASASMPYLSRIITVNGSKYLDGGVTDSIPIDKTAEMGYDKIITVLTRPAEYRKKPSSPIPAKIAYRRYPAFADAINRRYAMYNAEAMRVCELERAGRSFVIRPSRVIPVRRFETDIEVLLQMYELGRSDTLARLDELKKYLES